MNIIDSSCWLEYLMASEIGVNIAAVIENPNELIVPTITLYEVYKKLSTEKNEDYAQEVIAYMQTGTVIELTADLSINAADVSRKNKLAMADSIVYATGLHYSALIYTCDKHFKDLPNVRYYPKAD
ncbi:MAG: type II toxin-antitoxin system VapC family toxin [Treponema sp.]|nr:type II toxin-antitoxin system VapC family toxin [Treponema sp.]